MVDDYSRSIGPLPRKKRVKGDPAIEAWGSDADILPGWGLDLSLNAPESRAALTQGAADGAAPSPLLAQLEAIQGPASALGQQSAGKLYQDYIAAKGGFSRPEEAAQESQEVAERTAQGAADTSRATSSDGPDTSGIFRRAAMDAFGNVGRALRGEATMRVAPEEQARAEMQRWLASKAQREAETGRLAQQERLAQMQAMLGLSKEQAATERAKLEAESREKVAQIGAESRAELEKARQGRKPVGAPVAPKPPKGKLELDENGNIVATTAAEERLRMKKAAVEPPMGYELADKAKFAGQAFPDTSAAHEFHKALGAVNALKNHRKHAMEALERMRKAPFPSREFDTALGVLNQQLGNVSAKLRASEGLPNTEAMQVQVESMLSMSHGSAANVRNLMNSGRLEALLDSAVESADTNLGSLEGLANIKPKGGTAGGDVILVDKSDGVETSFPKSEAEEMVKADPARFSIKGG